MGEDVEKSAHWGENQGNRAAERRRRTERRKEAKGRGMEERYILLVACQLMISMEMQTQ